MSDFARRLTRSMGFVLVLLVFSPCVAASGHVVPSDDLHASLVAKQTSRQADIDRLNRFFESAQANKTLRDAHVDFKKVQQAVSMLNDEELSRITAQLDHLDSQFEAGLTSGQLTLIVLALAVTIIVVVIAAAT
jgi:Flp pilus assembly protein TadB